MTNLPAETSNDIFNEAGVDSNKLIFIITFVQSASNEFEGNNGNLGFCSICVNGFICCTKDEPPDPIKRSSLILGIISGNNQTGNNTKFLKDSVVFRVTDLMQIPAELTVLLDKDKKAETFFETLADSYRKGYCDWVGSAKQESTRQIRAEKALKMLQNGQKTLKT